MTAIIGIDLLVAIGLIVVFATIFNFIFRALKQPALLAYIIAGLVIGPAGLGALNIVFEGIPLGITKLDEIFILSELGIAFLLFSVGIESDFSKLKSVWKTCVFGGILQVVLTALIVFMISNFFNILPFQEALYLGVILAFSSTIVVVKILSDSYEIDTLHGRLMVGFLVVQDILVIIAMPVLQNLESVLQLGFYSQFLLSGLIIVVLGFILTKFVYPSIFRFSIKSNELLFLTTLAVCFVFIFLSITVLKLPMAIGAFIAGLSLSTLPYNLEIYNAIKGVRDFFVTIFFVSLGMQLTFAFSKTILVLLFLTIILTYLIKPVIFYLITLFRGFGGKTALMVALGLSQVSEFSFIVASQGFNAGVISQELFSIIILIVAVSMVLTPYFFSYRNAFYSLFSRIGFFFPILKNKLFYSRINELESSEEMKDHVIVIGGGTMGASLAEALNELNIKVLLVDRNAEIVTKMSKKGFNIIYGLASNPIIWHKLNIEKAKLLVLAIPDALASIKLLKYAKKVNPEIPVFARAHYYQGAVSLYENDADYVCMPHIIGSNVLLKAIIEFIENKDKTKAAKLKSEFFDYLEKKAKEQNEMLGPRFKRTDLLD